MSDNKKPAVADCRSNGARTLTAFELQNPTDMPIRPAAAERAWMDHSRGRFAYRCLPLVIANQSGWVIACPRRFTARWNGGHRPQDLRLWFGRDRRDPRILSHFGEGVITFWLPYLFRTPPGVNLWVKGPANWIKDGVQPLEGVVETDWAVAPFTMNWKLTRPGAPVRFEAGEPICMIVPVPRGLTDGLEPRLCRLRDDGELERQHRVWSRRRARFLKQLDRLAPDAVRRGWQKDYMQGRDSFGESHPQHQTRLHLLEFVRK